MRKNILAKRILCALALGGIACGAFATAYAEDVIVGKNIIIDTQDKVTDTNQDYFNTTGGNYRIYPKSSLSSNVLTFNGNNGDLDFKYTQSQGTYYISVYGGYKDRDSYSISNNAVNFTGGNFTNVSSIVGGQSYEGHATNNKVTIDASTINPSNSSSISGGTVSNTSSKGNAVSNTVEITNKSTVTIENIYGGNVLGYGNACNNHITIRNSTVNITTGIYGGNSTGGSAQYNTVEIIDSKILGTSSNNPKSRYGIYGGYNGTNSLLDVTSNHVTITNSTVNVNICGGLFWDADYNDKGNEPKKTVSVSNNDITIEGSTITGNLYANYNGGLGDSTNGVITINNSTINGNVYSNYNYGNSGVGKNGTITVKGASDISNAALYGANKNTGSNNKLILDDWSGKVKVVNNFDSIDFENVEWKNGTTVLTITDPNTQTSLKDTEININSFKNASEIKEKQSMTFITTTNGSADLGIDENNVTAKAFTAGVTGIGEGELTVDNGKITYTVKEIKANPQLNLIAENRAVAAAFVNQGSDLIADGLASLAEQYDYGFKTFAAVYGNRSSYDVSDDLKINGWSDIVGFGRTHKTGAGDFDWGVFYENGTGNYRTYNNFNSEFFRGDGNLLYNGGGVAARLRRDDGFYYEGSLRAGTLKSEMSNAVKDGAGNSYGYESDSTYYGAHVGVGKMLDLGGDKELDVYGKYFHTYVDGDSFNIDGDKFTFDSVKSDRVRIGAQLTTNKSNKWSAVYGLAYEYEFSGDSDMRAAQFDLPTQSLEGGTVIGKIGLKFKDAAASPWSLDLNLTGYQGQRDGFSGMVQVTYNF